MDVPQIPNNLSRDSNSPSSKIFSIDSFRMAINIIKSAFNKQEKAGYINELLHLDGLVLHYKSRSTGCVLLAESNKFEYNHEFRTCLKLCDEQYNVVLAPHGYFKQLEKKFDVFLCRDHIFIESDLKCINSKNPDTIAARIRKGSEQSSRLVLDIRSDIKKLALIDGLQSGCVRNKLIQEIMLFYCGKFYRLPKTQILSKDIFNLIK